MEKIARKEAPAISPLGYPEHLLKPGTTYGTVTEEVASIPLQRTRSS